MSIFLCKAKKAGSNEWVEGYYVRTDESHQIYIGYPNCDCGGFAPDAYIIDPDTLCRGTGRVDKNGERIFEHSLCSTMEGYCRIEWDHEQARFIMAYGGGYDEAFDSETDSNIKVIGNMFDNGDLYVVRGQKKLFERGGTRNV